MAEFLVHRAVDGQSFAFPPGAVFETCVGRFRSPGSPHIPRDSAPDPELTFALSGLCRLDSLKRAVGELTCVEPSDVIPFFGNGEQLREDNVVSAGSAGWDEVRTDPPEPA